jgi:hypothetical protein
MGSSPLGFINPRIRRNPRTDNDPRVWRQQGKDKETLLFILVLFLYPYFKKYPTKKTDFEI